MYYKTFAVLLVLTIALAAFLPRPALSSTSSTGVVIPLYTYPTDATWTTVINTHNSYPDVPLLVIADPTSSGAGSSSDPNYVTGIRNMQAAGITVIGYVDTLYTGRSIASSKADIANWWNWYKVNGIFLDEMSNSGGYESYYSTLTAYAKSLGMTYVMGNPGTTIPVSYIGTVDSFVLYESPGLPTINTLSGYSGYSKSNFAYLAYSISTLNTAFEVNSASYVGWLYITNDGGGNPWDTLPPYFSQEVAALEPAPPTTTTTTSTSTTTATTTTATTSTVASSAAITVLSVSLAGAQFAGIWTVIQQGSTTLYSGYTPVTFTGVVGQQYTVSVANYKTTLFDHWDDGTRNPSRTITLTQNTALTAYYKTAVSLTVKSATLSGQAFSGMRAVIKSGATTVKSGYTPLTYTAESGTMYTITAYSTTNHVFDHWDDGTTNPTRTISTSTQNVVLIAYYKS